MLVLYALVLLVMGQDLPDQTAQTPNPSLDDPAASTTRRRKGRQPVDIHSTVTSVNSARIVNGQQPIDFSSPNYPLHELGFAGASAPKLPTPEIFPESMHLAYPTPLAVVTEHTPSITYPYVNQRIHYKICGYNTTLCSPSAPPEHQPSRGWRSVLPGQSIGLSMYNLDDQQPGLTLNSILIRQVRLGRLETET